ncbi:hypothetical protein CULT_440008 [[Clostridium] ultunense Esp]|nr:hypothetical protein CULT_440008 [[Clostridium] ultunense Esp]
MGAARIYGAYAIPYPVGNPDLTSEKEQEFRYDLVVNALKLLI